MVPAIIGTLQDRNHASINRIASPYLQDLSAPTLRPSQSCREMARFLRMLQFVTEDIPLVVLREFDPEDANGFALALELGIIPSSPFPKTLLPRLFGSFGYSSLF